MAGLLIWQVLTESVREGYCLIKYFVGFLKMYVSMS